MLHLNIVLMLLYSNYWDKTHLAQAIIHKLKGLTKIIIKHTKVSKKSFCLSPI